MWQILLGSAKFMTPFYVFAIAYAEAAVCVFARRLRLLVLWAAGAIAVLMFLEYWTSGPSYVHETRPLAEFIMFLWIVSVPVALLSAVALLATHAKRVAVQQALIILTATATVFFWPAFALYSVCASGLDCL